MINFLGSAFFKEVFKTKPIYERYLMRREEVLALDLTAFGKCNYVGALLLVELNN